MKALIVVIASVSLLVGCAKTYTWVKPGATNAEFYKAKSYCQAISTGATPMDYSGPSSSTTYHNGSVYSSGGSYGSYSGTSTTYYNNTGQAFANLGQSIQRQNMFNDCMRGEGWAPEGESQHSQGHGRVFKPIADRPPSPDIGATAEPLASSLPLELSDLPYSGSKIMHKLTAVSTLIIIGETDDFYKVKTSNGKAGWSLKNLVQKVKSEPQEIVGSDSKLAISNDSKRVPMQSSLPLTFYRTPSVKSDVAFVLTEQSELTVIEEVGEMLMVEDKDKHWGWILKATVETIE